MSTIAVRTLGRYHLLAQVGRGGMASVFKAYDPAQDRYVALKVLSPEMAQLKQFSQRFRREAEVLMGLKHPNIVPVEDYGEEDGYAYLVMPLLEVGSLADRLQAGPLSSHEGSRVMEGVSAGLQYAHDQGVVHRDVKPSNILLDGGGDALVSDFGLARIHDASVSLTGSALLGTPAYMSPEQAQGKPADARSDQYALGIILYQLSTGTLPFDAETPMAVVLKQINEPVPLARGRSPNVPAIVERVILKSTAKDPEHRFESVAEMNRTFQAALAHSQDPSSNPAPSIELPRRPSAVQAQQQTLVQPGQRRRRLLQAASLAALLLLLLLACPLTSGTLLSMVGLGPGAALAPETTPPPMSVDQLTELAGTIGAMSTELAGAKDGTLSPESIPTLVVETLVAEQSSGTPSLTATGAAPEGTASSSTTPSASLTASFSAFGDPSQTPSRTPTKTRTPTLGPSATASKTPTATKIASPGPSPTPTKSPTPSTSLTPTQTATSTPSKTPTPPPTAVPSPTPTPTAVPSPTPPPPTSTPDPCENLGLGGFVLLDKKIYINVVNDRPQDVQIVQLYLNWPSENDNLKKVRLGSDTLWDRDDEDPPTGIPTPDGGWKSGANRWVGVGETRVMTLEFDEEVVPFPYVLDLSFQNGCTLHQGP